MSKRTSLFGDSIQYNNKVIGIMFAILCVLVGAFYLFFYKGNSGTTAGPAGTTAQSPNTPDRSPGPSTTTRSKFIALISDKFYYSMISQDYPAGGAISWLPVNISGITAGNVKDFSININGSVVVVATDGSLWYSRYITSGTWVLINPNAKATNVSSVNINSNYDRIYSINTDGMVNLYMKVNDIYNEVPYVLPLPPTSTEGTTNNTFTSISANPDGSVFVSTDANKLWYMNTMNGKWTKQLDGGGGALSSSNGIVVMIGTNGIYYYIRNDDNISPFNGPKPHPTLGVSWKSVYYISGSIPSAVVATDSNNNLWYCKNIAISQPTWEQYSGKQGTKLMISHFYT